MATNKPSKSETQSDTSTDHSETVESRFTAADRKQTVPSSTASVYNSSAEASVHLPDSTSSKQDSLKDQTTTPPTTSLTSLNIQQGSDAAPFEDEFRFNRDIRIKHDRDSYHCLVAAMAAVSDNELVIVDYDNKSVKMVNVDNDVISSYITFDTKPCDITTLPNREVAVTFSAEQLMRILSTTSGLSIKKSIKVSGDCLAVEYCNNYIYISYCNPVKIQILSLSGGVRKSIIPNSKCLEFINMPRFIAVDIKDSSSTILYVSDWTRNTIISMDQHGKMLAVYNDEGLVKPFDITKTPFGSIYVCNSGQGIIYKMSEDLGEGLVILGQQDGLKCPHSMCFCPSRKSLYISSGLDVPNYFNFIKQFIYN
ncbi:hypothetical protein ACF0H5_023635 [Mactra antiquata]